MSRDAIAAARSFLFVPGDRAERFDKAMAAGADQVIVDLEDAVAAGAKDAARANVLDWLSAGRSALVRVNAVTTEAFAGDLAVCAHPHVAGIVLPKSESDADLARIRAIAPDLPLLPLVESAKGLHDAPALAGSGNVVRLLFGSIDFQLDMGIPADGEGLATFRSQLVMASRLGGCAPPVEGVTAALDDPAVLSADIARAKAFGFAGKLCIHPRQVAAVNEGFAPSARERAWAEAVMAAVDAAADAGRAAIAVGGEMIDRPVILKAQAILRRVGRA